MTEDAPRYATRDQMRALAHPVRLEIVEQVGRRGTARAADVAADLGLPANSVSYHLRILARGGVIVEDPEAARDRRDRVWRLAQHSFEPAGAVGADGAGGADLLADPEYRAAAGALSLSAIDWMRAAWVGEISRRTAEAGERSGAGDQDADDRPPGHLWATTLRLSADQARELAAVVDEKLTEYNQLNRDEQGAYRPEDPDSEGGTHDYRILFALVADRPPSPESLG